jgi:hypothetical protein
VPTTRDSRKLIFDRINDNLNLTVSYKSTINDDAPDDLRMDSFMVSFVYGWHKLIEGSRRLKEE